MSGMPPEAQGFIKRMLEIIRPIRRTISTHLCSDGCPRFPPCYPGSWGGKIPPITLPGRHQKLDANATAQPFPSREIPPVLVDAGCGFAPVTTAETARHLPHWRILGVDPAFVEYVLYDADGHYACF
jgi:hypothetical protein